MPQRFTIALAQVKAGNTLESLAKKKIRQIIYFLYRTKEIIKKSL